MEITVPDLGDFADVEVVEVLVAIGDTVAVDDPLIVLETEKATMEIPSPAQGTITDLAVKAGDRVSTGDAIARIETAAGVAAAASDAGAVATPEPAADVAGPAVDAAASAAADAPDEEITVTVPDLGDFSDVEVVDVIASAGAEVERDDPLIVLETEKATMEVPAPQPGRIVTLAVKRGDRVSSGDAIGTLRVRADAASVSGPVEVTEPLPESLRQPPSPSATTRQIASPQTLVEKAIDERGFSRAHASPSVRKLARELGVDLAAITGSGRKGRVTADDLKAFVKRIMLGESRVAGGALPAVPDVDFEKFGAVERQKLSRIQRISGPRLHASWVNVPHVTQHDEADVTELEAARQAMKAGAQRSGVHLTPLAFVMRAVVAALEEFPVFRSSLDRDGETLVIKQYFHVGFAADTPNGLVVPVMRNVDQLGVLEIARSLGELSEKARNGTLAASDMQGGVFTISSLGGIGGTFFTPIINAPEVAILGVSRTQQRPVYRDGALLPRLIMPLSLSYDHRVIDGATAVRFTTRLVALLGQATTFGEVGA